MINIKAARNILETSIEAVEGSVQDYTLGELKDLISEILDNEEVDYDLVLEGGDVRLIDEEDIEDIWTESLIELVDCNDLGDLPAYVSIDWEKTVENLKVDGLGHHFNLYDGEERHSEGWYIFRTN
jgi:hypothetical protein